MTTEFQMIVELVNEALRLLNCRCSVTTGGDLCTCGVTTFKLEKKPELIRDLLQDHREWLDE